jgi:hypothetical protein
MTPCRSRRGANKVGLKPMIPSAIDTVLAHWSRKTESGLLPAAGDLDLRAIRRALPDVFVLDAGETGHYRFRLAGTRLCAVYGRELRDHDFVRLWPGDQQAALRRAMAKALKAREVLRLEAAGSALHGPAFAFSVLLLPLAGDDGAPAKFLGVYADGRPRRDADAILTTQRLESLRAGTAAPAVTLEAAPPAAFLAAKPTSVPFLRVVEGGAGGMPAFAPARRPAMS